MELKDLENLKVNDVKVLRSEVWYVDSIGTVGSEQHGERPAVIVSNDIGNKNAPVVEIVYITTQIKSKLPTHVTINNFKLTGTALCENVTTIDKSRLKNRLTRLTDQQMSLIEKAMCISLDITKKPGTQQIQHIAEPTAFMLIPGENYIIKQANQHVQKVIEIGTNLSRVEEELTKIAQADITLGGVNGDYLSEELKNEIRIKASESIRSKKVTLEHELLTLMEPKNEPEKVERMEEAKDVTREDKPIKADASDQALAKAEKELDFEAVKKAYLEEGLNLGDLGRKFHKAPGTMSAYLKAHGICKPKGGYNRKPR